MLPTLNAMNSNLKNIVILGTATLFIVLFWALFQIQKDGEFQREAEIKAVMLAELDAMKSIESGDITLLGGAHGWGLDEVPAVGISTYKSCLSKTVPIRLYREYTDVVIQGSPKDNYDRLVNNPETTYIYAEKYNSVVINHINQAGLTKCI